MRRVHLAILSTAVALGSAAAVRAASPGSHGDIPEAGDVRGRDVQSAAARANAMAALRESVLRLEVGRGLRVRDVVDRTGPAANELSTALSTARTLGGPRWVDEQTCQVQVTVSGAAVADALAAMAGRYPGGRLPVRPNELNARLANWRATAFTATGSSVAAGAVQQARPRQLAGRWATVPDAVRRRAVADAQADAVRVAIEDVTHALGPGVPGPAAVSVHVTAAALSRPFVVGQLRTYLVGQPGTKIEFLSDLTVSVSIAVDAESVAEVVERAVTEDQPRLAAEAARAGEWPAVRSAVGRTVPAVVTGTGSAAAAAPTVGAASNLPAVVLPVQPPGWFEGVLEGEGSAVAPAGQRSNTLRVRGTARAAAVAQLRDRLLALRVTATLTLADAARTDPQLAAAVSRVLLDAEDDKVDVKADGSVHVHAHLNLRDAWDQLRSNP